MSSSEQKRLAGEILRYSRQTLLKQWPWMGPLLYQLQFRADDEARLMGSDGEYLYYNPNHVIKAYKEAPDQIPRIMIHLLGHCMLDHIGRRKGRDHQLYDAACDLAVFQLVEKFPGGRAFAGTPEQRTKVKEVLPKAEHLSAETLYIEGGKDAAMAKKFEEVIPHVHRDDHQHWRKQKDQKNGNGQNGMANGWRQAMTRAMEQYQKAMMGQMPGRGRGDWTQMIDLGIEEEAISYEDLLKKFAAPVETMRIDMDSLDLSWYVTGLNLYGDLPIVEYNEYRDMNLVETFVIAIDTSGSCCGETLNRFLTQTRKVMEDMQLQGRKIRMRIIQCDWDIQEEVELRTKEEFDSYVEDFRIRGGGGTSFIPVFERVNTLVAEEEGYSDLKGFLYFSDGFGDFPKDPTPYETVFVIPEDDLRYNPPVPDWVTVACLKEKSLDLLV